MKICIECHKVLDKDREEYDICEECEELDRLDDSEYNLDGEEDTL